MHGAAAKRIIEAKLNAIPEFGRLNMISREEHHAMIEWLITNKYILQTKGKYPVLHLTYNGMHYDGTMMENQLKQLKNIWKDE